MDIYFAMSRQLQLHEHKALSFAFLRLKIDWQKKERKLEVLHRSLARRCSSRRRSIVSNLAWQQFSYWWHTPNNTHTPHTHGTHVWIIVYFAVGHNRTELDSWINKNINCIFIMIIKYSGLSVTNAQRHSNITTWQRAIMECVVAGEQRCTHSHARQCTAWRVRLYVYWIPTYAGWRVDWRWRAVVLEGGKEWSTPLYACVCRYVVANWLDCCLYICCL